MNYLSTRGGASAKNFTDVLLDGLAPDGGLYIPEQWPVLSDSQITSFAGAAYQDIALAVTTPFIGKTIDTKIMGNLLATVYQNQFTHDCVAPLVQIAPNSWILELFHGPTLAFKDYALQVLGQLFDHVLGQRGERATIVGATSGDTGSAAIEACKGCKNIDIFILHPKGRTSDVQRRQMTTVDAPNVFNIALEGTFDDCQSIVKALFNDQAFRRETRLSAVNSINWARIMAQIVYYVSASAALGAPRRKISFAVPTGNFGNVYAAYCARKMGLPIEQLIIGSNRNDILTRFFETGVMQSSIVEPSLSPSMDIQISSNFERYLCDLFDRDTEAVNSLMQQFKDTGRFTISPDRLDRARESFDARRCSDDETQNIMRLCYQETGYILDPHTAVGLHAGLQARDPDSISPLVSLACAHPAKFPDAVERAIGLRPPLPPYLSDLFDRKEIMTVLPNDVSRVQDFIRANI